MAEADDFDRAEEAYRARQLYEPGDDYSLWRVVRGNVPNSIISKYQKFLKQENGSLGSEEEEITQNINGFLKDQSPPRYFNIDPEGNEGDNSLIFDTNIRNRAQEYVNILSDGVIKTLKSGGQSSELGRIISLKEANPEKVSLFLEIQWALKTVKDPQVRRVLLDARGQILNAARQAGVVDYVKNSRETRDGSEDILCRTKNINWSDVERESRNNTIFNSTDFFGVASSLVFENIVHEQIALADLVGKDDLKNKIIGSYADIKIENINQDLINRVKVETARSIMNSKTKQVNNQETERTLTETDLKELEKYERELVNVIINESFAHAQESLINNQCVYPYSHEYAKINEAVEELKALKRVLRGREERVDRRTEIVLERLDIITNWFDAQQKLIAAEGVMLEAHFDCWTMLQCIQDKHRQQNLETSTLGQMFTVGKDIEGWGFGKELRDKQDASYEILRAMAAAGRHKGRNMGKEIVTGDYADTENQIEFIEKVFGKGREIETIHEQHISSAELERRISQTGKVEVLIGQGYKYEDRSLKELKGLRLGDDEGLWVDGVEWQRGGVVGEELVNKIAYKKDSGDAFFIGRRGTVDGRSLNDTLRQTTGKTIAVVGTTPEEVVTLFTMTQGKDSVEGIKRKISLMMEKIGNEKSIWDRLNEKGSDTEELIEEFDRKLLENERKKDNPINRLIIDTTYNTLRYGLEGADLGWGFKYKEDGGVFKREMNEGSTPVVTDIGAAFWWARMEGKNTHRGWSKGLVSMDPRFGHQFVDHEPGWAPNIDSRGGWLLTFMDRSLELDLPTTFDYRLFNVFGSNNKSMLQMAREGVKMSEMPWGEIDQNRTQYWLVTLGQLVYPAVMLTKPMEEETFKRFARVTRTGIPSSAPFAEIVKRADLSLRLTEEKESNMGRFIPALQAWSFAWEENLLPSSEEPGFFYTNKVERRGKYRSSLLDNFEYKGGGGIDGREMANRFQRIVDWTMETGMEYAHRSYRNMKR